MLREASWTDELPEIDGWRCALCTASGLATPAISRVPRKIAHVLCQADLSNFPTHLGPQYLSATPPSGWIPLRRRREIAGRGQMYRARTSADGLTWTFRCGRLKFHDGTRGSWPATCGEPHRTGPRATRLGLISRRSRRNFFGVDDRTINGCSDALSDMLLRLQEQLAGRMRTALTDRTF